MEIPKHFQNRPIGYQIIVSSALVLFYFYHFQENITSSFDTLQRIYFRITAGDLSIVIILCAIFDNKREKERPNAIYIFPSKEDGNSKANSRKSIARKIAFFDSSSLYLENKLCEQECRNLKNTFANNHFQSRAQKKIPRKKCIIIKKWQMANGKWHTMLNVQYVLVLYE